MKGWLTALGLAAVALVCGGSGWTAEAAAEISIARQWNELLLEAIRNDFARPTVHARNLFHTSIAMWDGFAAYDPRSATYLHHEVAATAATDLAAAREETISFAAYRVLRARFTSSPGAAETLPALDARMDALGYDRSFESLVGSSPAALGNRIAQSVLTLGESDGANESNDYANLFYAPVNPTLLPAFPGNPRIFDVNRWQPLALDFFIDQSGNPFPLGVPPFLGPEWGAVTPFALREQDRRVYERDGNEYVLFHDPGAPPRLGGAGNAEYRAGFLQVLEWSSLLDPTDGSLIDISPATRGDNSLGTNDGNGRAENPSTGAPYAEQSVPAGDYYRVLAEFWADGPDSETPPGHWFVLANEVGDHPSLVHRIGGSGQPLDRLEWDVKLYLALGGAMHDAAVAAWGVKGWYDYVRPVSAIRYMVDRGQSSDALLQSYDPDGISLVPGLVELVTPETILPGERHAHLAGAAGENIGKIAVRSWRGPDYIGAPETTTAGVGWILGENWWPYQRPSFVTPPFAGYVSGHSTFSRAAATVLTRFTGDEYFPGGLGEFVAAQNEFLVFEDGPSVDIALQWATYYDAADECSLSRIYGGIHPPADDIPGRLMGAQIGADAFEKAGESFDPPQYLTIERARAGLPRSGRHRIKVRGKLTIGEASTEPTLDPSQGMSITLRYGATGLASARLDESDFRVSRSGGIRARSADKAVKLRLRPARNTPGEYDFWLKLKLDRPEGDVSPGEVTLQIEAAGLSGGGLIASCTHEAEKAKLLCR